MTSHTAAITMEQAEKLRSLLEERGYELEQKNHALFAARKGKLNVTVYQKGPKVLIQGRETEDFVRFVLEPEILGEARLGYEEELEPDRFAPHFGIDESGKGDYFGPLVIAGVYTDAAITRALTTAGVTDSKKISSSARIRAVAEKIRGVPGCVWEIVSIGPERYNEMFASFANLNRLLAWGHARVIENLARRVPDCPRALSDQFARPEVLQRALASVNSTIQLEQRTKAEADPAVAAASILARERFVDWMEKTSLSCDVVLPLGASPMVEQAGREFTARHGPGALPKIAKMHFQTTRRILTNPG
ncbi:MAG: ribonuclease HIII [Verrucomicrobiota bacterium]